MLNKVALSVQVNMKADLREIYGASTRAAAESAIDVFADKYGAKYEKAVACLTKDREALLAFFDFPAEHWDHLRTSNPIESVFATVRHRTVRTKGSLSATTAKLMVFKLVTAAAKTWRRLKGENQLPKVVRGVRFQNGIEVIEMPAHHAAWPICQLSGCSRRRSRSPLCRPNMPSMMLYGPRAQSRSGGPEQCVTELTRLIRPLSQRSSTTSYWPSAVGSRHNAGPR